MIIFSTHYFDMMALVRFSILFTLSALQLVIIISKLIIYRKRRICHQASIFTCIEVIMVVSNLKLLIMIPSI